MDIVSAFSQTALSSFCFWAACYQIARYTRGRLPIPHFIMFILFWVISSFALAYLGDVARLIIGLIGGLSILLTLAFLIINWMMARRQRRGK